MGEVSQKVSLRLICRILSKPQQLNKNCSERIFSSISLIITDNLLHLAKMSEVLIACSFL